MISAAIFLVYGEKLNYPSAIFIVMDFWLLVCTYVIVTFI